METPLPLTIDTLPTPNPDALMFKLQEPLVERGSFEYTRAKSGDSPLPKRLFSLDGVDQVLVTTRFVTVTKKEEWRWPELVPAIKGLLREHVASGEPAVHEEEAVVLSGDDSELGQRIAAIIDAQVRPAVAMDGGDVQFIGITEDMYVELRLIGACSSCPSALTTLRLGIETMLMDEFPEIAGVEQVA
jgi:Fe-S cluster biogenesis protein NfuA